MDRTIVDKEVLHAYKEEDLLLDATTLAAMWELFVQIGKFWGTVDDPSGMKSQWLVFINNRIRTNPTYVMEYRNAAELIEAMGENAYETLFTDYFANIAPPTTRLARARQLVSNEFVTLQLALGGFKVFGAKNHPGYFGGANIKGKTPYRTIEDGS